MRDAVRNTERWKRRRAPTQDPSTYRVLLDRDLRADQPRELEAAGLDAVLALEPHAEGAAAVREVAVGHLALLAAVAVVRAVGAARRADAVLAVGARLGLHHALLAANATRAAALARGALAVAALPRMLNTRGVSSFID